jgi:hypothetical protein
VAMLITPPLALVVNANKRSGCLDLPGPGEPVSRDASRSSRPSHSPDPVPATIVRLHHPTRSLSWIGPALWDGTGARQRRLGPPGRKPRHLRSARGARVRRSPGLRPAPPDQ